MTVYFLGAGNMGAAIIRSMVKSGFGDIVAASRTAARRDALAQELGIRTCATLPPLQAEDVLVLAVKPVDMQNACAQVEVNDALVVSVAAGLSVAVLSRYLGGTRRIVRAMPNTPAAVGRGVTGLFAPPEVGSEDRARAEQLFHSCGQTLWVADEAQLHDITAIAGSGPAYVFYLLHALQQAAQKLGFDADEARALSLATFQGAVALAGAGTESFETLARNVASKGGTTEAALSAFAAHRVDEGIGAGVAACRERSEEIAERFEAQA